MDNIIKFEDFLDRMQGLLDKAKKQGHIIVRVEDLENTFPELKESEDERIRKALIRFHKSSIDIDGIKGDDILAWLEKQGEQKSADKVEPKFHEGDWITNGDYTWKIVEVKPLDYILQAQDGNIVDDTISHVDEQFHSFTIQDAKDGDVLVDKSDNRECPFIFKETKPSDIKTDMLNPLTVLGYCGIGGAGFTKGSGWGDTANCIYYPATKEQRDILFEEMQKKGYEWDADKKELKKIHVIDEGKAEMDYCFTKMTNGEKVSSAWSEEDEENLTNCIEAINLNYKWDNMVDWLNSLKERYTWKPSEKQLNELHKVITNTGFNPYVIKSLYDDLKKLRGE